MRIRRIVVGAAAAALSVTAVASPASAQAEPPTLAGILAAQGGGTDYNGSDFDILAAGVAAAGLTGALDAPDADLTVFLPNDRAFRALVADLFGFRYWFAAEATVLAKVVELEVAQPGTLSTVILYHAVAGQIPSDVALSVAPGTELTTLQGATLRVYPTPGAGTAMLRDQDPDDFNAFLVPGALDIQASNGIAHAITRVLRPVNL